MNKFYLFIILLIGCSTPKAPSAYEQLLAFEGTYAYVNEGTLELVASAMDTTLYAVIDNAKYPLNHIGSDSFTNIQETPVVFQRDQSN